MAINNEDPCKDIRPPSVDSTGDEGGGQEVPPPMEQDVQDETLGLFPSFEIQGEVKAVDRSVHMIDQHLYYLPGYPDELRAPDGAYNQFMRLNTKSTSSIDNTVDPFRYTVGKVYNSLHSEISGRIQLRNQSYTPNQVGLRLRTAPVTQARQHRVLGRIPSDPNIGLPFSVEHFNVYNSQLNGDPNSEYKSLTIFDVRFSIDNWRRVIEYDYYRRGYDIETNPLPPLIEQYNSYIMGKDYAGAGRVGIPLFPLRNPEQGDFVPNRFLDHTFEAPSAYYRKEVENSNLPIQDSVLIESVVNFAPDPNWDEEERDIELEELAASGEVLEIMDPDEEDLTGLPQLMPDDEVPQEHRIMSIYKKFNIDYNNGQNPVIENMSQRFQIFPSDSIQRMLHVNSEATNVARQTSFYDEASELLNSHAKISFSMHHNTSQDSIVSMMSRTEFDPDSEESHDAVDAYIFNLMVAKYPSDGTFFTQIIDQTLTFFDPVDREAQGQVDYFGLNDKVKRDYRPQSLLDLPSIMNRYYTPGGSEARNIKEENFPLGIHQHTALGEMSLKFDHLKADILSEHGFSRSYRDILTGRKAHSEVIGYRIEKVDTFSNRVLQDFYIFNDPDIVEFDFLDTQVVYSKQYTYKIYTINLVIGNQYRYEISDDADGISAPLNSDMGTDIELGQYQRNTRGRINDSRFIPESGLRIIGGGSSGFQARLEVKARSKPMISIIEAPYFQQTITIGDLPPLYPEVRYQPYAGEDTLVEFVFSPRAGSLVEEPIAILPTDREILNKMTTSQVPDNEGKIKYSFDSNVRRYEILLLEEPPVSYLSFANSRLIKVSGRAPSKNLRVVPNKDYYVCFRSVDDAGFSNPSPVYRYNLQSYGNGIEHIFEIFDFVEQNSYRMTRQEMTLESTVSVKPSVMQRTVNFSGIIDEGQTEMQLENFTTAPSVEELTLGNVNPEDSIWNRKFKFRFISRTTGKTIDFNIKFKQFRKVGELYNQIVRYAVNIPGLGAGVDIASVAQSLTNRTQSYQERIASNRADSNNRTRGIATREENIETITRFENFTPLDINNDSGDY
tara:strand:- start:22748 stop:25936 length:3189 start_codon:yes stop_codon:yes gene_type:complete